VEWPKEQKLIRFHGDLYHSLDLGFLVMDHSQYPEMFLEYSLFVVVIPIDSLE